MNHNNGSYYDGMMVAEEKSGRIQDVKSTGFGDTLGLGYNGETIVKNVPQNFGMNY